MNDFKLVIYSIRFYTVMILYSVVQGRGFNAIIVHDMYYVHSFDSACRERRYTKNITILKP